MKRIFTLLLAAVLLGVTNASAAVSIKETKGWFESGYVTWEKVAGYAYNVYVSPASAENWTKLDNELVREYPDYGRADMVGLKAGEYKFKVVPVKDGAEVSDEAAVTEAFTAVAYDRDGFAHFKSANASFNPAGGVGAYKNDGTLKDGAKVIYVTADNAKTITTDVVVSDKGKTETATGLQTIISKYEKGCDKTPIAFRIIGLVKGDNLDNMGSSAEGLQIKGKSYSELNITIEGIGDDATIHGFGFLIRSACSVELRNFAIMWAMDDGVSMDTDNTNIWVHNLDIFYGKNGGGDKAKGDGALDSKGTTYSTYSYNHFWDCGKCNLLENGSEEYSYKDGSLYLTYHHNWYDHSDSRHPRVRYDNVHVYNNYYDGNAKYGVGSTNGSSVFVEANHYRNCKFPMLTSMQGNDLYAATTTASNDHATFSKEDGGTIKSFNNYITGATASYMPYGATAYLVKGKTGQDLGIDTKTHFDAYEAKTRDEQVSSDVTSLKGGHHYSNFDTNPSLMYSYTPDAPADVPSIVTGDLGAGRCNHGDFQWTFDAAEDTNYDVIAALSTAILNYKSTLMGFFGETVGDGGNQGDDPGIGDNPGTGDEPGTGDNPGGDATDGKIYSYTDKVGTTTLGQGAAEGKLGNYNGIKLGKNVDYVQMTPVESADGFKAGDIVYITGYADGADRPLILTSSSAGKDKDVLYTTPAVANKKNSETPTAAEYTLTADYPSLYVWRGVGSTMYVVELCVVRPTSSTGIADNLTEKRGDDAIYDLFGRRVVTPVKPGIYIINGKKVYKSFGL